MPPGPRIFEEVPVVPPLETFSRSHKWAKTGLKSCCFTQETRFWGVLGGFWGFWGVRGGGGGGGVGGGGGSHGEKWGVFGGHFLVIFGAYGEEILLG